MNTNDRRSRTAAAAAKISVCAVSAWSCCVGAAEELHTLDEVVVSATRRLTNLQETALSITALSNEDIQERSLVGMGDYLNTVAGVTMQDRGVGRATIVVRGVSIDPQSEGNTTGVYLGDIPLTGLAGGSSPDLKLVDMQRVEVLRGPQGTLYGASSLGGTVRNIPMKPDLTNLEGEVAASYSITDQASSGNSMLQGVLNLPLVENKFGLRVVGYHYDNAGYIDNVAADDPITSFVAEYNGVPELAVNRKSIGGSKYTGGRATMLWAPTEAFSAELTAIKQDLEQDGFPEVQLNKPDKFQQARLDIRRFVPGGEHLQDDLEIANLLLNYDMGWASITSSTSLTKDSKVESRDLRPGFAPGTFFGDFLLPELLVYDTDGTFQEIRVASDLDGPMQFILGGYYEEFDRKMTLDLYHGADPALGLNPFGDDPLIGTNRRTVSFEQTSFFGELSYEAWDVLTLTVGARFFDYTKRDLQIQGGALGGPVIDLTTKNSGETLKANISYQPSDDALVYAQWSEGFRPGSANGPVPASFCDVDNDSIVDGTSFNVNSIKDIDPDSLENFELGSKLNLLNRRVVLNAAVYKIDWSGLPVSFVPPCGFGFTVNGGSAEIEGAELEAKFYPTDSLELGVSATHTDAKLADNAESLGGRAGERLPGSADFSASGFARYDFRVGPYDAFARGDYSYVGSYYTSVKPSNRDEVGDYHLVNLRAGITIHNVTWGLFVNNLTNADDLTWLDTELGEDGRGLRLAPRTVGLDLRYNFGR